MSAVVALVGCGKNNKPNTCYWCKESIKEAALICKHCGKNPSTPSALIIEKAIRKEIVKPEGELTKPDFEKVTKLSLVGGNLTDLKTLTKLLNLQSLVLLQTKASDLNPLSKLTHLKELYLVDNQITNVSPLSRLTQLEVLHLTLNQITNVSALTELSRLKELRLDNNPGLSTAKITELQKILPKCNIIPNIKPAQAGWTSYPNGSNATK